MKAGKKTRQLPSRGGLKDLEKSGRTIADYAKASPLKPDEASPNVIQNLRAAKK